ncbi:GIY-YIG nuclease family protein [Vibrio sp. ZSDZ65]|uniref:GIY-YIG nuclease family protein n=1 Tax=Vibrio qingdaonensis TaxID=2829491 RepID=A0A9X3HZ58_9VIBR|nr:GIY-YIG nuclease family protein [Vibrio qingdaonensis]MCW8348998.1 GIY-YIG nuclease family protein [Vibrio qingdaonensis]
MTLSDEELSELLGDVDEGAQIGWCDVQPVLQPLRKRNPDNVFDNATSFLKDISAVVYKIDDGTRCYVGRTVSLRHRLQRHATNRKSKAFGILKEYKGDKNNLISIVWRGPYPESITQEANAIEKYSTVGQTREQAIAGQMPLKSPNRKRDNSIPDMNKTKKRCYK